MKKRLDILLVEQGLATGRDKAKALIMSGQVYVNDQKCDKAGEEYKETALREVSEETGVSASIIKYIGKSQYTFNTPQNTVLKDVHWYLMMSDSYYSKPQREEYFMDSGYYKFHEAYHMLKFANEKQILERAYNEYVDLKKSNLWGNKKYF